MSFYRWLLCEKSCTTMLQAFLSSLSPNTAWAWNTCCKALHWMRYLWLHALSALHYCTWPSFMQFTGITVRTYYKILYRQWLTWFCSNSRTIIDVMGIEKLLRYTGNVFVGLIVCSYDCCAVIIRHVTLTAFRMPHVTWHGQTSAFLWYCVYVYTMMLFDLIS